MDNNLFKPESKLSEVVSAYPALLYTLSRFGLSLGFGDKSIAGVCAEWGVSTQFFLLVCNVTCIDGYEPTITQIKNTDMTQMVPYLKKAHEFYLSNRLPHIAKHLSAILQHMKPNVAAAFRQFFNAYHSEVEEHFAYEEKHVFPMMEQLMNGEMKDTFEIKQFLEQHESLQDKLDDINQLIFKYVPANWEDNNMDSINVVFDILQLSADLGKHSLVEEKVLLPYILYMERKLR